jgi:hypothetical protein
MSECKNCGASEWVRSVHPRKVGVVVCAYCASPKQTVRAPSFASSDIRIGGSVKNSTIITGSNSVIVTRSK